MWAQRPPTDTPTPDIERLRCTPGSNLAGRYERRPVYCSCECKREICATSVPPKEGHGMRPFLSLRIWNGINGPKKNLVSFLKSQNIQVNPFTQEDC